MTYRTSSAETRLDLREQMLASELADVRMKLEALPADDPFGPALASEETRIELELDHVRRALGLVARRVPPPPPQPKKSRLLVVLAILYMVAIFYLCSPPH